MLAKTEGFYIPSANMLKGVSCDIFGAFISILHQTEQQKNTCPKVTQQRGSLFQTKEPGYRSHKQQNVKPECEC